MPRPAALPATVAAPADRRWRIVLARDPRYDSAFVYAVRSTGIYCRPSCPSRRPGRRQVRFFATSTAAERAGFRACRRCHPGRALEPDPRVGMVRDACALIDAAPAEPWGLARLAARLGTTPPRLVRAFRAVLGVSPRQYRDERRLDRFKRQLRERRGVSPALYEAGYGSPSRVYERAALQLGMTPATYRHGGLGVRVRYATARCPLGWVLVAATERGVCRIAFADAPGALARALRLEFPRAHVAPGHAMLRGAIAAVLAHLGGDARRLDLPLDVRATAFQRRVWEALRRIPYGATRTYAAVARAVGRPRAARAVARACAANPVALAIPCHRVVRGDGEPGGYRWGVARKRELLEREAAAHSA
jgi:AraC family transcriptional regulator, regulatory protein of adaptative response / methylated-DNA-[protein]-cysteine methyltransferase